MKKLFITVGLILFLITNSYGEEKKLYIDSTPSFNITKDLYLDLMKRCVTNWIYGDSEKRAGVGGNILTRMFVKLLNSRGYQIVKPTPMDPDMRIYGKDHSPIAHTMIGLKRLDNLQFCIENVLSNNIPGDLIECGAWRGGATIFMRAVLKAYNIKDRVVYVADSFEGCPKPNIKKYPQDKGSNLYLFEELAVSLEQVKTNFDRYGLLDDQVYFLKGWFKNTLPKAPIKKLAVLRIDADLYESTMDSLVNLYPKLSIGGYIIVDDFGTYPACKQAVLDYRKANGINDEMIKIDLTGIYWQKSKS